MGWTTADVIHADDLPGLLETWRRVLTSGQPDEAEARVRRSDGGYRWFLIRAVPVRSDDSVIVERRHVNAALCVRDGYRFEQSATVELSMTEDTQEAQRAFAEKRKPVFKGR